MTEVTNIYIPTSDECVLAAEADGFEKRFIKAIQESKHCVVANDANSADLVVINQKWGFRNWHHFGEIESCNFLEKHSHKTVTISHDDVAVTFLPGLYTSLTLNNRFQNWAEPCGYKRQYRSAIDTELSEADSSENRRWLFSFRGADFSHPIRKKLAQLYFGKSEEYNYVTVNKKFHSHSEEDYSTYINEMMGSQFVLAPRGFSPSTYRMFEAMQYGRCPVIISDDWQSIAGVDWDKCSIRIAECEIGDLYNILSERSSESTILGFNSKSIWRENFSDGIRETEMLKNLLGVHAKCNRDRDFEKLKKFWHSRKFFHAHGWTMAQRFKRKIELG